MKFFLLFLIAILILQSFTEAISATNDEDHVGDEDSLFRKTQATTKINCKYACARRCRLTSRLKVCTRACGTCCGKCHCVPPGTSGNHNACPCYASLKTHGNKLKCP